MTENTAGAKTRTAKSFTSGVPGFDRPMTEGTEAVRELADQSAAYSRDMYEKTKAGAEETNKVLGQAYGTVTKGAADFNLQWIEMARANANAAFDFAGQLVRVKSPSECLELSAAHARDQLETFTKQAQQLTALAQRVTTASFSRCRPA